MHMNQLEVIFAVHLAGAEKNDPGLAVGFAMYKLMFPRDHPAGDAGWKSRQKMLSRIRIDTSFLATLQCSTKQRLIFIPSFDIIAFVNGFLGYLRTLTLSGTCLTTKIMSYMH